MFHLQIRFVHGRQIATNCQSCVPHSKMMQDAVIQRGGGTRGESCAMQGKFRGRRATQSIHLFLKPFEEINNSETVA